MCGIVGVASPTHEVADDIYVACWALQHRGQVSAGMVTIYSQHGEGYERMGEGTVDVALGRQPLSLLRGTVGIGHVRYSTAGGSTLRDCQPVSGYFRGKKFWVAHNGNLVNARGLRDTCIRENYNFVTSTDTEVIVALISLSSKTDFDGALLEALRLVQGTFALVILYDGLIYGVRDRSGKWRLMAGSGRGIYVLASETAVFDHLQIRFSREIMPGEIFKVCVYSSARTDDGFSVESSEIENGRTGGINSREQRPCVFEHVYFQRPDSVISGRRVDAVRRKMGRRLAREAPVSADIVVPVPDSGISAAIGFSQESGIPFEPHGLFRFHYVGRTFIEPIPGRREKGVRIKFNPIPENVRGRRVVVVDDSIVRATVIKQVVKYLREAGAAEVHVRISSPVYRYRCYYGIDTYRIEGELVGERLGGDIEAIQQEIGADSLHYLSVDGMKEAIFEVPGDPDTERDYCVACFTGEYDIPVPEEFRARSS